MNNEEHAVIETLVASELTYYPVGTIFGLTHASQPGAQNQL